MTADDLTQAVKTILRDHRQHVSENFPAPGICVSRCSDSQPRWPCGAYRAASAVEAALKLGDRWAALAPADDWGDTPADTVAADCGRTLREAIRAGLTGQEGSDGR